MIAKERAKNIRLLIIDVDGVLTDGQLYLGENGETHKSFNQRDSVGIQWLHKSNVITAVISEQQSAITQRYAESLSIEHIIQSAPNKSIALVKLCKQLDIDLCETAYIGDDVTDLAAIKSVGLGCAVADSDPLVRVNANWQSDFHGGEGAVRQLAEMILEAQNKLTAIHKNYLL